jgi:hypothetical protein
MLYIASKILFAILISGTVLTVVACGAGIPDQDIRPISPVGVQLENEADAVEAPEPSASLPAEIGEPTSPVSPIIPEAAPAMAPINKGVPPIPGSEAALAAAVADLTQQTSLPADQITLVSIEGRDWSDASLGCPQEGMMYAQVITPGYLIILEVQGQQYEYHTDQTTNVILCNQ